ncbi:MAG: hypothetical protein IJT98_08430 [Prevotella sp.]|nr:hypothetical protein [Prevotella sp.]
MKRNYHRTILIIAALAAVTAANAASWRINSDAAKHAHFSDINAAMSSDAVVDGDTLYLDPGSKLTTQQNVTKRVTIIGCGHTTAGRPYEYATITGGLYLKADNIKVEAIYINSRTQIEACNITVERCRCGFITYGGTLAQRATIRQCYVLNRIYGPGGNSSVTKRLNTAYWTIENCIIIVSSTYHSIYGLYKAVIRNNYIKQNYNNLSYQPLSNLKECTVTNNIILKTGGSYWNYVYRANSLTDGNIFQHNVMSNKGANFYYSSTYYNTFQKDKNILLGSADEAAVFALAGSNDELYRLKDSSPAKGCADDGGDCGPYGGLYPYVPGGIPQGMPVPVTATVPSNAQDGHIRISIQTTIQKQ